MNYESTANELAHRIAAMIPAHPEILELDSPFPLFKLGLQCDDLAPSLFQASWALQRAKQIVRLTNGQ